MRRISIIFVLALGVLAVSASMFVVLQSKPTDQKALRGRSEFGGVDVSQGTDREQEKTQRIVSKTGGVRASVPPDEIISGGPPQDGIPSIDKPKFVSAEKAILLSDSDLGIAFERDGVKRFYPFSILVWHEIVNDTIKGNRILVTYCPLCLSGVVFDPLVDGGRVEFGTSGKLWNSNLVMYDRKTESLWSQILGEAIMGRMTGARLTVLPSDVMRFGDWKKSNPTGEVLSRDTGLSRDYGRDPYGDYYSTPGTYFPVKRKDTRLSEKAHIIGFVKDGKAKAYAIDAIKKSESVQDTFAGMFIIAKAEADGSVRLYEKTNDGLKQLGTTYSFWFSWAAAHPSTELYK